MSVLEKHISDHCSNMETKVDFSSLEAMSLGAWTLTETRGVSCSPCVDTPHITERQAQAKEAILNQGHLCPVNSSPKERKTLFDSMNSGQRPMLRCILHLAFMKSGQFCVLPAGDARP